MYSNSQNPARIKFLYQKIFRQCAYLGSQRPGFEFILARNIPWQQIVVILHSKYDFPDAWMINGHSTLLMSNETFEAHTIKIRKKQGRS